MAKVEVDKEAVLAANDSTPQHHYHQQQQQRQQQKPNPTYRDRISSATVVEYHGLSSSMRVHATRAAAKAFRAFWNPYDAARYIGQLFEDAYGRSWECVVASNADGETPRVGTWV